MIPNTKQRRVLGHHTFCSHYKNDPGTCRICNHLWQEFPLPNDLEELKKLELPQEFWIAIWEDLDD